MERQATRIVLCLGLVFASGIAVGALGDHWVSVKTVSAKAPQKASPEEWRRQYLNEMQTRLHLTTDQVARFNAILDASTEKFHDARQSHDEAVKRIRENQLQAIRSILTDEQRPEYEKLRAEREQRIKAAAAANAK